MGFVEGALPVCLGISYDCKIKCTKTSNYTSKHVPMFT